METKTDIIPLTRFGHALSDSTRSRMLEMLSEGPCYPADMVDKLSSTKQSISNHLACLRGCGLVITTNEGRRTRYELADERISHALNDLRQIVLSTDPAFCEKSNEKECC